MIERISLLFFLAALALAGGEAVAQCKVLGGGCAGAKAPFCTGEPKVGNMAFAVSGTMTCTQGPMHAALGFCGPAAVALPALSPACTGCKTWISLSGPLFLFGIWPLHLPIPNNAALVGGTLCVQPMCVEIPLKCVQLHQTIEIVIKA